MFIFLGQIADWGDLCARVARAFSKLCVCGCQRRSYQLSHAENRISWTCSMMQMSQAMLSKSYILKIYVYHIFTASPLYKTYLQLTNLHLYASNVQKPPQCHNHTLHQPTNQPPVEAGPGPELLWLVPCPPSPASRGGSWVFRLNLFAAKTHTQTLHKNWHMYTYNIPNSR